MDTTPLMLGQEISGWVQQLKNGKKSVEMTLDGLRELALGGTALEQVSTRIQIMQFVAEEITKFQGMSLEPLPINLSLWRLTMRWFLLQVQKELLPPL